MGLWAWLKSLRKPAHQPEADFVVSLDGELITFRDPDGALHEVDLGRLRAVVIETDDSGPWGMDLWWLLFGADDRVAAAFPGGATGEQAVIDQLMRLPGFAHQEMVKAMCSTQVAAFVLWRDEAEPISPSASD